tara:strand:+ start:9725 stop:10117 length:393 start_codon:yes stop_codon:yes gene_type:complete
MTNYGWISEQKGIQFHKSTGTGTQADPFVPETVTTIEGHLDFDTAVNFAVTVGSTSSIIRGTDADRKLLVLVNDSDSVLFLSLGSAAVMNTGIRLNANGGSIVLENPIFTGPVYGICALGGKRIVGVAGL